MGRVGASVLVVNDGMAVGCREEVGEEVVGVVVAAKTVGLMLSSVAIPIDGAVVRPVVDGCIVVSVAVMVGCSDVSSVVG